jgi:site-specific DNA-methyltransferase (adenine-specific)
MPLKGHENILVFYKSLPTYNPQKYTVKRKDVGRVRNKKADRCVLYGHVEAQDWVETGQRYPHDVIHFSNWNGALFGKIEKATKHPTQKPVPVLEYLIKTYTNEGDTVLDNCMGSGSTGVACVNTGRDFICIELDDNYFQIAEKRINDAMAIREV